MLASYLLDATRPGHPLEETSLEHLGYKALTEEDVCGRGAKAVPFAQLAPGGAAQLRRRARRPRAPAVEPPGAAARDRSARAGLSRAGDAARAGAGRHRARRHPHRRPGAGRAVAAHRAGARRLHARGSSSWPARSSTSTRRSSSGEILFEKLQLTPGKKTGKTRSASTAAEVLEELALTHELPRLVLEWRGAAQAEEHLHRRAAADGASRRPAACTPASTRRSRRPGG